MAEEDYTCGIQSRMALLSQPDGDFDAIKMKTLFDLTFKVETLYDSISTSTSLHALSDRPDRPVCNYNNIYSILIGSYWQLSA